MFRPFVLVEMLEDCTQLRISDVQINKIQISHKCMSLMIYIYKKLNGILVGFQCKKLLTNKNP